MEDATERCINWPSEIPAEGVMQALENRRTPGISTGDSRLWAEEAEGVGSLSRWVERIRVERNHVGRDQDGRVQEGHV